MADWDGKGLVSTEWLARHLDDPTLRIFDVTVHLRPATPGPYRIESGRTDYEGAHIPGAAFLDHARDLSDPEAPLPFTMPSVGQLASALGADVITLPALEPATITNRTKALLAKLRRQ